MSPQKVIKPRLNKRYPTSTVWIYNATTVLHYILGSVGIMAGYNFAPLVGYPAGFVYLALAFAEMYIWMPMKVCPNCFYYKLEGSLCMAGLNVISQKVALEGKTADFGKRGAGPLCTDNLSLGILALPLVVMLPAFFFNFSIALLVCYAAVGILLVFRYAYFFPRLACRLCRSKAICPQAARLGVKVD
jgi:hypothetical protein